jgi:DNA-binding transcriptional ArsR family regulator
MVKYQQEMLDNVFSALADPTRRAILARLAEGESSVGELAEPFDISLPAISRHLRVLRNAGLVLRHKDGRVRRCALDAAPLKAASDWVETYRRFWDDQFDALAEYLEREQENSNAQPTNKPKENEK